MRGLKRLALTLISALLVVACGGGGGGGSSDSAIPQASLKYAGATTQATINSGNASTLSTQALSAQDNVNASSVATRAVNTPSPIEIVEAIILSSMQTTRAMTRVNQTEPGSCGGSMTVTSTSDSTGMLTFASYCSGFSGPSGPSVTLNGTVIFSGTTSTLGTTVSMSFIDVNAVQLPGNDIFVVAGTTTATFDPAGQLLIMTTSTVVKDNNGKTFWLDNYTIDNESSPGNVVVNGRFYHPDYGYVTISTPPAHPLVIVGHWPISGQIVVSGAANTAARLTAYSTGYTIAIDTGSGYGAESALIAWPTN